MAKPYTKICYASQTLPLTLYENWNVKNGQGQVIERWVVTDIWKAEDTGERMFSAEITKVRPFYNN